MLEGLATGKHLSAAEFKAQRKALRPALLRAQFALAGRGHPVLLVIAGPEGAGKGAVAHRLNEWMDPRLIETHALWRHSDEEEAHPYWWRFWRRLPPRGRMAIMLGHWYHDAFHGAVEGRLDDAGLAAAARDAAAFERLLQADGALVVKLWLHVSRERQRRQLAEEAPRRQQNPRVPGDPAYWWHQYPRAVAVAEQLLRHSDGPHVPWHLIDANESNQRDIAVARTVRRTLENHEPHPHAASAAPAGDAARHDRLAAVDLSRRVPRDRYERELARLQSRLQDLAWEAYWAERSLVAVFEGWDAAGKGSAIRRVTAAIDPRLFKLVQVAAPSDEERAHHYLWRFWRRLQRDGTATIFDRSWYGRVLVERVEGLTPEADWRAAYGEINDFERALVTHGSCVAKFWLHISKDEQLRRFRDRERKPHKRHKIGPEDWRNRERWQAYEAAVEDMVAHTDTVAAPWHLIAGDDKKAARLEILDLLCRHFESQPAKRAPGAGRG